MAGEDKQSEKRDSRDPMLQRSRGGGRVEAAFHEAGGVPETKAPYESVCRPGARRLLCIGVSLDPGEDRGSIAVVSEVSRFSWGP